MALFARSWGAEFLQAVRQCARPLCSSLASLPAPQEGSVSGHFEQPPSGTWACSLGAVSSSAGPSTSYHSQHTDPFSFRNSPWSGHERCGEYTQWRGAKAASGRKGDSSNKGQGGSSSKAEPAADEGGGSTIVEKEEARESPLYAASEDPTALTSADVNKFIRLSSEVRTTRFPEGLGKGLLEELQATNGGRIMLREQSLKLIWEVEAALAAKGAFVKEDLQYYAKGRKRDTPRPTLMLTGPAGSGKSLLLSTLVHWARASGWLVINIPSAKAFTDGGVYVKHEGSGLWDTPWQARDFLKNLLAVHGHELELIPMRIPSEQLGPAMGGTAALTPSERIRLGAALVKDGGTLRELAERGLEGEGEKAVEVAVRLRAELAQQTVLPLLIAIDDYNSWFALSNYDVNVGERSRAAIPAWELRFVNAYRQVHDLKHGMVVGAFSETSGLPQSSKHLPGYHLANYQKVDRYSLPELEAILSYYQSRGVLGVRPSPETIKKIFFLTNGNGKEVRRLADVLTELDRPVDVEEEEGSMLPQMPLSLTGSRRFGSGFS